MVAALGEGAGRYDLAIGCPSSPCLPKTDFFVRTWRLGGSGFICRERELSCSILRGAPRFRLNPGLDELVDAGESETGGGWEQWQMNHRRWGIRVSSERRDASRE